MIPSHVRARDLAAALGLTRDDLEDEIRKARSARNAARSDDELAALNVECDLIEHEKVRSRRGYTRQWTRQCAVRIALAMGKEVPPAWR